MNLDGNSCGIRASQPGQILQPARSRNGPVGENADVSASQGCGTAIATVAGMMTTPSEPSDARTFAIIGAAMEVHRVLGSGFLEIFYHDALAIEFGLRDIPFVAEAPCHVAYKGHPLRGHYRMDFVCFDSVVLLRYRRNLGHLRPWSN